MISLKFLIPGLLILIATLSIAQIARADATCQPYDFENSRGHFGSG